MIDYSLPMQPNLRRGQTHRFTPTAYMLFIFLTLLLAGCRSNSSAASPTLSPTATPESILSLPAQTPPPAKLANGWYLYADPASEFSFGYPPEAAISAGQNPVDGSKNILIQFLIPDQPYQGMSIRIEPNPNRLSAADFAQQLYTLSTQKQPAASFTDSLQTLQVGGIPAVRASIPASNTELTIIVPYAVEVFIVAPVHDLAATKVESETLELFYQVLNTMAFGLTR
jgi:hypothetical protein